MGNARTQLEIVALGARLPVGASAEASAAAVRAGINRVTRHPYLLDRAGEPLRCGRDALLEQAAYGNARMAALASAALAQVLRRVPRELPHRIPVLVAVPEERPGFGAADAQSLLRQLAVQVDREQVSPELVGRGHAGVFTALAQAGLRLSERTCELCVVGGADSYLHVDTLAWLDSERRLRCEDVPAGFIPGEGAVMLAVTLPGVGSRIGLAPVGRIRVVAHAIEKRSLDSDEGSLGEGLSEAVAVATASLSPGEVITDVFSDINGERYRSDEWGLSLLRHPRSFQDGSQYVSVAESGGDVGAASAALEVMLATRAFQRRYARGDRALAFAGSWQGARGVAVLESIESQCRR